MNSFFLNRYEQFNTLACYRKVFFFLSKSELNKKFKRKFNWTFLFLKKYNAYISKFLPVRYIIYLLLN